MHIYFLVISSWFRLLSFCLKGKALDGKSSAVIDYTPYLKFTQRYVRHSRFDLLIPKILGNTMHFDTENK